MHITSTAFQAKEPIPKEHAKDGDNISPPLTFSEVPPEAKSLALIVDDPDAPDGLFTHWIIYNMSPATLQIPAGGMPLEGTQATNDFGNQNYDGPMPPSGTHRYRFTFYALDIELEGLRPTDKRPQVMDAIEGHIIELAELVGMYSAEN